MLVQIQDFSICSAFVNIPSGITTYATIPRFIIGAMSLILALIRTVSDSVGMYKATKQWQPNRYIKLLARDGIVYFFVYVVLPISLPANLAHTLYLSPTSST